MLVLLVQVIMPAVEARALPSDVFSTQLPLGEHTGEEEGGAGSFADQALPAEEDGEEETDTRPESTTIVERIPIELIDPLPAAPSAWNNELIVCYQGEGLSQMSAMALPATDNLQIDGVDHLALLEVPVGVSLEDALAELQQDPNVLFAEPNYRVWAAADAVDQPNDPSLSDQWGLGAVQAPAAWLAHEQALTAADSVTVAVLDTGVDADHPDLSGRLLPGQNFAGYRDDHTPYTDPVDCADDHGHGTQVTGIIAAVHNNGLGISGVAGHAPVQVLPVKVLNDKAWGTVFDLAKGINYAAAAGARVINLSLTVEENSQTLAIAIRNAQAQGALVVSAVGDTWYRIYPAAYSGVIAVTAVDMYDYPWYEYTTRSDYLDLAAPGMDILTTGLSGSYTSVRGTSAAAAHVSAAAALYLLLNPQATPTDVGEALIGAADDIESEGEGWDNNTGHGMLNLVSLLGAPQGDIPTPVVRFVSPQSESPAIGEVELAVEVIDASSSVGVAFYLDEISSNTLLGQVAKSGPQQSLLALSWDTTNAADGQHTLYAQAYDDSLQLVGTKAELILQVSNQPESGITLRVLAPNGGAGANAILQLYRRMGENESGYQPDAPYCHMDEYVTDRAGIVQIPGNFALDLHNYVAVVQGACDMEEQWVDYLYVRTIEGPTGVVLDGANTVPVTFSLLDFDGEELPYALFLLRLKDAVGAPIAVVARTPVAGQAVAYVDEGLYDAYAYWSPMHAEEYDNYNSYEGPSYLLVEPEVALSESTASIQFDTEGAALLHGQVNGSNGQPISAELWLGLEGDAVDDIVSGDWGYLQFYEDEIVVTPGEYDFYCTAFYNNWDYSFRQEDFVVEDAGSLICDFGGQPSLVGQVTKPTLVENGYLNVQYQLLDSYANTITAIWRPEGSYFRARTTVTMVAYDQEESYLAQLKQMDFGYPYAIGQYFRNYQPGEYSVQLRVPLGPLYGSAQAATEMLPFAVVSDQPTVPDGRAIPVYDWEDQPVVSLEDRIELYSLIEDEWGRYGYEVDSFAPNEQGVIHIPEDIELSPIGNFIVYRGESAGDHLVYTQRFTTLDELTEVRFSDCSSQVELAVAGDIPAGEPETELFLLAEDSDGQQYPFYIGDLQPTMFVTPGLYTFLFYQMRDDTDAHYVWHHTVDVGVDAEIDVVMDDEIANLSLSLAGGMVLLPEEEPPARIYCPDAGFDMWWWPQQGPELQLSPGEYTIVVSPGLVDQEHVDDHRTLWQYALALSQDGSGRLQVAAEQELPLVAGGALSLDVALDQSDLTTADVLSGEIAITDPQGNRLVAVSMKSMWDERGGMYSPSQHLQLNPDGQLLVPQPEMMALADYWPFVYPFLRIYQIDPVSGAETRVFNQYHESYFYDFALALDQLTPGEYRLEAVIALGPLGTISDDVVFSLSKDSSAQLDALPAVTNQTDVALSGMAAPGATVAIYYHGGGQAEPVLAGTATADGFGRFSLIFSLPSGAPDGEHSFTARTVVSGVESPDSPAVSMLLDRVSPQPPTNLEGVAADANNVRLNWQASPAADVRGYRLSRDGTFLVEIDAATQLTYLDGGLTALTTYTYSLVAVDAAGNYSGEETIEVTTIAGVDTEPPVTPQRPEVIYQAGGKALVTWQPTTDNIAVTSYQLLRAIASEELLELGQVASDQPLQFEDSGLLASTDYSYRLRAYDAAGNQSEQSLPGELSTPPITIGALTFHYPVSDGRMDLRQINPSAEISVRLLSERQRQASVEFTYITALDQHGNPLPEPQEQTAKVDLVEEAAMPGVYTGTFSLPAGSVEVLDIMGIVTDGEHPVTAQAAHLPLQVTADLTVELPPGSIDQLTGLTLSVLASQGRGQTAIIEAGKSSYLFAHLVPASDYVVSIKGDYGRDLLRQSIAVLSGVPNRLVASPLLKASLSVLVRDPEGKPLPGTSVYAYNQFTRLAATAKTGPDGLADLDLDLVAGEMVKIQAQLQNELPALPYQERQEALRAVAAGSNLVQIDMEQLPMATITGVVTLEEDAAVMPGVTVAAAVNKSGARSFSYSTITGPDGSYTLEVPAGTVRMSVSSPEGHVCSQLLTSGSFYLTPDQIRHLDLSLSMRGLAQVDVELHTKYIDEPEAIVDGMDWWTAVHFRLRARDSSGRECSGYPLDLWAQPNEVITVSVDGCEAGLPRAEAQVQLDDERKGKAVIHLEEYGRVVGRLVDDQGNDFPLGPRPQDWVAELLVLDEWGREVRSEMRVNLDGPAFQVPAPGPGPYMLRVRHAVPGVAAVNVKAGPIDVGLYQIVDLGKINPAWGDNNAQGNVRISAPEVSAGTIISASAVLGRRKASPMTMDDAKLTLDLPAGCELVAGGLSFEGQAVAAEGGNQVSLGNLQFSGTVQKTLQFMVQLAAELPVTDRLLITARLDWTEGTFAKQQHLIPAEVPLIRATLEGPALVVRRQTVVGGRGPAGASIAVYDGTQLLGVTEVSPGGYWQLRVELPDWGSPVQHYLYAIAERGGQSAQSNQLVVTYDPQQPVITEITFRQGRDGQLVTFNPADGTARFPYVIRPGAGGFQVTLRFSHPELVKGVEVAVPPYQADAIKVSDDQYFAEVNWGGHALGALYIEYETRYDPAQLLQQELAERFDEDPEAAEDQFRQQSPPGVSDYEAATCPDPLPPPAPDDPLDDWTEGEDVHIASCDFTFPQDPDIKALVTLATALVSYEPSQAELDWVAETGIPVYGLNIVGPIVMSDRIIMWVEAYVPLDALTAQRFGIASVGSALRTLNRVDWTPLKPVVDMNEKVNDLNSLLGGPGQFDDLKALQDQAFECGENSQLYLDLLNIAAKSLMVGNVLKWSMKAAGLFLTPATFGLGTIALFAASEALDRAVDTHARNRVAQIRNDMAQDPECRPDDDNDDDDDDEWWHKVAEDIRRKKAAEPTWIWDPSGIVYSGVMENPVPDVRATLYAVDPDSGELTLWNSEWFGQQNPLQTDAKGYYGWDVPVGQWQVIYEKPGYAVAQSAVLPVPPPQTEVHINLVNLAAPQLITAEAVADGSYLQLNFDQYMLADTLVAENISLTYVGDAGIEFVTGTLQATAAVPAPWDPAVQLTRAVRFVPDVPLTAAVEYQLTVSGAVQSYGGIPMGGDYGKAILLPAADPLPVEVENLELNADSAWVDVSWDEPAAGCQQVKLVCREVVSGTEVDQVLLAPGVEHHLISGLFSDTEYRVKVSTIDGLGRESAGSVSQVKTLSVAEWPPQPPVDPPNPPEDPPQPPGDPDPPIVPPVDDGDAASLTLSGEQQTMAAFGDGFRLSIPAGAFAPGVLLNIGRQATADAEPPLAGTLSLLSALYSCATTGPAEPGAPLFIALQYDQELLGGSDACKLGIYRQDEQHPGQWIYVGGAADLFNQRLTARISQLGTYAVLLCQPTFTDSVGHWGQRDIEVMAARGLAAGVGGGNFDPNRPITRAELFSFMVRLVLYGGLQVDDVGEPVATSYSDVTAGAWYSGVVTAAAQLGLLSPSDDLVRPGEPASRAEMAAMLVRVMELLGQPAPTAGIPTPPFSDLQGLSEQAYLAVAQAWIKGLMGGMGAGSFLPQGTATRVQVAAVMLRVLERAGLLTTTMVEKGTLQAHPEDANKWLLVNCDGSVSEYSLRAISAEVEQQLQSLVGQTVQVTALRVQNTIPPALRVLTVAKSASG